MNILVVDDEKLILMDLRKAVESCLPGGRIHCFESAEDALFHTVDTPIDVAFLDINLAGISGVELALRLQERNHEINIIFVTGYAGYAENAFAMHASGYVRKPVRVEHIRRELENLRYPPKPSPQVCIRIRCFGTFEVFVDGRALGLSRCKARELLAYLVHRKGAGVTNAEIAAVLWEDKPYTRSLQHQIQRTIGRLEKALAEAGARGMLVRRRGVISVDPAQYTSDYADFLKGNVRSRNAYHGEYMAEYSWAEFMAGTLTQMALTARE